MITFAKNIYRYRELLAALAWRSITVRYKQAYMGIAWAVLKPLTLMVIFVILRSFIGIDSGPIPYPILTYAALTLWVFFQESAAEGITSVVGNAGLIRKIYFPREIFPLASVLTKLVELGINLCILAGLMTWYGILPGVQALWMPVLVLYTILASLTISLAGAAANVYYRDVATAFPLIISLLMYLSPIIYPLDLVKQKLLVEQIAGDWSNSLYTLYTVNPIAGIISSTQNILLKALPPDFATLLPGIVLVAVLLPLSYLFFKHAESYFADVI